MCCECGCGEAFNDHQDDRHLTYPDLVNAATASDIPVLQAAENILATVRATSAPDAFTAAASRPLIVTDIDGVLAMYAEGATIAVNVAFGTNYSPLNWLSYAGPFDADQSDWLADVRATQSHFWSCLAPDTAALAALAQIFAAGFTVLCASDRPASMIPTSAVWLDQWGVPRSALAVQGPGSKEELASTHGPQRQMILIDDSPTKWATVARDGVQVWTPMRPWTPSYRPANVRVFSDWSEPLGWLSVT